MADTIIEDNDDFQIIRSTSVAGRTDRLVWKAGSQGANRETIEAQARQALIDNRVYIARANPTTAQNTAQLKALSQQNNRIIRLLLNQLDGTD